MPSTSHRKRPKILTPNKAAGLDISSFDIVQLKKGVKVETEHTGDKWIAAQIAMDHLAEFPDYYTRLEKMEKAAEKYWSKRRK